MFITFEGIDGSGKSTQSRLLVDRLGRSGHRVRLFREPGGTDLSERIRSVLLDSTLRIHPIAELLLFASARAQLVDEAIRPELDRGTIVVCDRFYDSTTTYQGAGRAIVELDWVKALNRKVTGGLVPDRTYYIAISPALGLGRREGRVDSRVGDRMEASDVSFYQRVVSAYEDLAAAEPDRIVRLDGRASIDEVHEAIWSDVQELRVRRGG